MLMSRPRWDDVDESLDRIESIVLKLAWRMDKRDEAHNYKHTNQLLRTPALRKGTSHCSCQSKALHFNLAERVPFYYARVQNSTSLPSCERNFANE